MSNKFTIIFLIVLSINLYATRLLAPISQKTFTINLISNQSAGYSWNLIYYDPKKITYIEPINKRTNNLIGSNSMITWTFTIKDNVNPGENTTIKFVQKRPWENKENKTYIARIFFI